MKKLFLGTLGLLTFLGLTLLISGLSVPVRGQDEPVTPPTPPSSEEGLATGGVIAMMDETTVKLNFNAHQGSVWGRAMYSDSTGMKASGDVDVCYDQDGNQAIFAGEVDKGNVAEKYFVVQVQDNGEGKNAEPDMLSVWFTDEVPSCSMVESLDAEVQKGNLQVH